ncbi:MAG TPA: hypothetical protein VFH48_45595 [Chloroflexota bacterium]|nr:hypothetical protein [Chloroflexota bacterium]
MSGPAGAWVLAIGDRVVLIRTGQAATVLRLAPTEWGLLCDLEFDPPAGSNRPAARRVHASTELRPLEK